MFRRNVLLSVVRLCRVFQERTLLGDQSAYYKVQQREKLRRRFDVRDYEKDLSTIKGFGGWNRPKVSGYNGRQRGGFEAGAGLKPVNFFSAENLPLIVRDYYTVHERVAQRSQAEVDAFLKKHEMTLEGNDIPHPVLSFEEANFDKRISSILESKYDAPTSIQSISWPVAMSGRDLISIARTGSGKTLCFLLPGIMHTAHQSERAPDQPNAPTVLVLVPTRELAQQVEQVARDYCRAMRQRLVCLFGGSSKNVQAANLARNVDICVATPGRLLDFLEAGVISMARCSYLVLDEADRMLDMGFEPQIRKVISQIRPDRQTLMFYATWPMEIRALASDFQRNPVFLNISNSRIIYTVDLLKERASQYLEAKDSAQACEKSFQACKLAMMDYVKRLESASNIKIVPELENPWNYKMFSKLIRLLMKKVDSDVAKEMGFGWRQAFEFYVKGWTQNDLSVEDVKFFLPYVFRFLDIFVKELKVNQQMAIYVKKNLFNLNLEQLASEINEEAKDGKVDLILQNINIRKDLLKKLNYIYEKKYKESLSNILFKNKDAMNKYFT